jgi:hypothetical protein
MATLTRPSDSKITNDESPSLIESTDDDLATTVPAPFPQLQRTEVPVGSTPAPELTLHRGDSQNTTQRIQEITTRPGLHPENEIETTKVESVSSLCLYAISRTLLSLEYAHGVIVRQVLGFTP